MLIAARELLWREAGIPSDTTHRERINRIVAGDRQDTLTVAHDDVPPLTDGFEAPLFALLGQRPDD